MRATILCKLGMLGLGAALCVATAAGATVQKAPAVSSDVVLAAQKHGKARPRGPTKQQRMMEGVKQYLPPEYQQYLGGQGGMGTGGMGTGGMGR